MCPATVGLFEYSTVHRENHGLSRHQSNPEQPLISNNNGLAPGVGVAKGNAFLWHLPPGVVSGGLLPHYDALEKIRLSTSARGMDQTNVTPMSVLAPPAVEVVRKGVGADCSR